MPYMNIIQTVTGEYEDEIERLRTAFDQADAIVIGAGSGLSTSAGLDFAGERLKQIFGDFGLFQCSKPCHAKTYDNYDVLKQMIEQEKDMKVPTELIPHCPKCGRELDFNLFWDNTFVRDEGWHIAHERYEKYLDAHETGKILYLELGVGYNSPGVIKFPFWQMAAKNPDAVFASVNLAAPSYPARLAGRSIVISKDIHQVISDLGR